MPGSVRRRKRLRQRTQSVGEGPLHPRVFPKTRRDTDVRASATRPASQSSRPPAKAVMPNQGYRRPSSQRAAGATAGAKLEEPDRSWQPRAKTRSLRADGPPRRTPRTASRMVCRRGARESAAVVAAMLPSGSTNSTPSSPGHRPVGHRGEESPTSRPLRLQEYMDERH